MAQRRRGRKLSTGVRDFGEGFAEVVVLIGRLVHYLKCRVEEFDGCFFVWTAGDKQPTPVVNGANGRLHTREQTLTVFCRKKSVLFESEFLFCAKFIRVIAGDKGVHG